MVKKPSFDPAKLARYTVIRLPWHFSGHVSPKFFVILAHVGSRAACIKATSKTDHHKKDREIMDGTVFYAAGEVSAVFTQDTAIEPDNQFLIPHAQILKAHQDLTLDCHEHCLPDFEKKLLSAIQKSVKLSPREKKKITALIKL